MAMSFAFADIYRNNVWGFGSGHGSLTNVTKGYRSFVETFIRENGVRSVVDYGCGDWQFSRLINWGDAEYTGVDVVESVVAANQKQYGRCGVRFELNNGKARSGDLLLVKDVLQHFSDDDIEDFLRDVLPRFRFALITNCVLPESILNASISTGSFRPLDLRKAPFKFPATAVYSFTGPKTYSWRKRMYFPAWKKIVLLAMGD
jgi:SAM-dependent methyltransferase